MQLRPVLLAAAMMAAVPIASAGGAASAFDTPQKPSTLPRLPVSHGHPKKSAGKMGSRHRTPPPGVLLPTHESTRGLPTPTPRP
jgi:hypothetical protein